MEFSEDDLELIHAVLLISNVFEHEVVKHSKGVSQGLTDIRVYIHELLLVELYDLRHEGNHTFSKHLS